jgi:hypothetical protein
MDKDYTLSSFLRDPIPSMLCHTQLVKVMGQTTSFDSAHVRAGSTIYSWPKGQRNVYFTEGMIRKTFSIRLGSANGLGFT